MAGTIVLLTHRHQHHLIGIRRDEGWAYVSEIPAQLEEVTHWREYAWSKLQKAMLSYRWFNTLSIVNAAILLQDEWKHFKIQIQYAKIMNIFVQQKYKTVCKHSNAVLSHEYPMSIWFQLDSFILVTSSTRSMIVRLNSLLLKALEGSQLVFMTFIYLYAPNIKNPQLVLYSPSLVFCRLWPFNLFRNKRNLVLFLLLHVYCM